MRDKYKIDVRVDADPRADSGRKDVARCCSNRSGSSSSMRSSTPARIASPWSWRSTRRPAAHHRLGSGNRVSSPPDSTIDRRLPGRLGLFSIRERLTLLGGRVESTAPLAREPRCGSWHARPRLHRRRQRGDVDVRLRSERPCRRQRPRAAGRAQDSHRGRSRGRSQRAPRHAPSAAAVSVVGTRPTASRRSLTRARYGLTSF